MKLKLIEYLALTTLLPTKYSRSTVAILKMYSELVLNLAYVLLECFHAILIHYLYHHKRVC